MNAEATDDPAVANAANWLRLIFHVLTCNNPACVLEERCAGGKLLLSHILACSSTGACTISSCTSVRRLTLHWLRCQEPGCRLCAGVWRDLSGYDEQHDRPERQLFQAQDINLDASPPEQPGTPDREGSPELMDSGDRNDHSHNSAAAMAVGTGAWTRPTGGFQPSVVAGNALGQNASSAGVTTPANPANRAVLQLQEATSYMRYLLHTLMCKHSRDAASRVAGRTFWLDVLSPPQQPQPQQQYQMHQQQYQSQASSGMEDGGMGAAVEAAGGAGGAAGAGAVGEAYLEPPSAAPTLAGRRLVMHRLTCRNPYCALCAGTCELFTRGHALRSELRAPNTMRDMDNIVQELSMALGSINL